METGMIVEKQELFFLISCKGAKRCPAVFEPDERGKPEEILESLFRKGRIANVGERFQVDRELADAVSRITEAKSFLCLCHGNRQHELLYLYPGEQVLAVQEMRTRRQALRLSFMDRGKLFSYLEEQDLLAEEQGWEPLPYADETLPLLPAQLKRRGDLADYPWIWLLVEEIDGQSGRMLRHVGIVRAGFKNEIVTEDTEVYEESRESYDAEHFVSKLLEWIESSGCEQSGKDGTGK